MTFAGMQTRATRARLRFAVAHRVGRSLLTEDFLPGEVLRLVLGFPGNADVAAAAQCCRELAAAAERAAEARVRGTPRDVRLCWDPARLHRDGEPWLRTLCTLQALQTRSVALARRTLTLRRRALGAHHLDVAASLFDVAVALRGRGRYEQAAAAARLGLDVQERRRVRVGAAAVLLAGMLQLAGRPGAALAPAERGCRAAEAHGTVEELATARLVYAQVLHTLHRQDEALRAVRSAQTLSAAAVGEASLLHTEALGLAGRVLRFLGQRAEALLWQRRAVALRGEMYGQQHPSVAAALTELAGTLRSAGRLPEALRAYRRALATVRSTQPAHHPNVAVGEMNVARCLRSAGRYAKALRHAQAALRLRRRALPPGHRALESAERLCRSCGRRFDD